jgi:hypothetical protein
MLTMLLEECSRVDAFCTKSKSFYLVFILVCATIMRALYMDHYLSYSMPKLCRGVDWRNQRTQYREHTETSQNTTTIRTTRRSVLNVMKAREHGNQLLTWKKTYRLQI